MIIFPNAKINIGLNILGKRNDGFHEIETIMYPIGLCDALEFIVNKNDKKTTMRISGIKIDGDIENNLVIKAYKEIKINHKIPPLNIYLRKNIPFGAGLGGGSSDGAFMITMLNDYFKLGMSINEMEDIAAKLGSDCPFFIKNGPAISKGRGEIFSPINIKIKGYNLTLLKPKDVVSTAEAYNNCTKSESKTSLIEDISNLPIPKWQEKIINGFEKNVFINHPYIKNIKKILYNLGAEYVSMSGSGSSIYALSKKPLNLGNSFSDCFVWKELL